MVGVKEMSQASNIDILIPNHGYFVLIREDSNWHLFDESFKKRSLQEYLKYSLALRPRIINAPSTKRKSLIIFISEACNLRCDYCKVSAMISAKNKTKTNSEAILSAIMEISNLDLEYIDLTFYGGEPLLEYKSIDHICTEIGKLESNINFSFSLTTNGTLINEKILSVINKHNISVGVSIDGSQAIHDSSRIFIRGKGSYSRVIENYKLMKRSGVSCGPISVIADPRNLSNVFSFFTENFNDNNIYLKPLEVKGNEDLSYLNDYFQTLAYEQLLLLEKNLEIYKNTGKKLYEVRMKNVIDGVINSHISGYKSCRTSGNIKQGMYNEYSCSISHEIEGIEADGDRIPCPNIKQHKNKSEKRLTEISNRGGYCYNCVYQKVCPSFCMAEMDENYLDRFFESNDTGPIDVLCEYNKKLINGVFDFYRRDSEALINYSL